MYSLNDYAKLLLNLFPNLIFNFRNMTSKDALTKNIEINPDLISNNEARSRESINECHGHAHNGTKLKSTHALTIMMFFTGIFFLIEIIVGNVTHSNTLVAVS
jgi:hypothetical protein